MKIVNARKNRGSCCGMSREEIKKTIEKEILSNLSIHSYTDLCGSKTITITYDGACVGSVDLPDI